MKINNVRIYGLEESVIASGYPYRTEIPVGDEFYNLATNLTKLIHFDLDLGDEEAAQRLKRIKKLAKTPKGSAHDQALTGIHVDFDLTCTNKMWVEMERYRFVYFVSSQSTIHKISDFDLSNSYIEYVDPRMVEIMEELKDRYNKTQDKDDYYKLLYSNPAGFELTARLTTNYRSLKTIYSQRRNHKLQEWQDFCKWIETLPMAKELILGRD